MALTRSKKAENVEKLASELKGSTSAIIGTFAGLTASKDFDLRKTVRGAGGSYHVVKNKLAARAGQGTRIEAALQGLKGVSSVAYTSGDPVVLAKALSTWVKDNAEFTFKLAIVDGQVLSVEQIGELATMPGKEELFSKLLFLINSPAQRLATVINATGRDLAVVLGQGVEKERFTAVGSTTAQAPATSVETSTSAPASPDPVAAAHAEEAPTPAEQIARHPASEADPQAESASGSQADPAQPENSTASQGGEAASTNPVEG